VQAAQVAMASHDEAILHREALELFARDRQIEASRIELSGQLDSAISSLWVAYQPIVSAHDGRIVAYEALLRSREPELPHPVAVFEACERLGRVHEVGRAVRRRVAAEIASLDGGVDVFVNAHPQDLLDPDLVDPDAPLSEVASRVVIEITERAGLGAIDDLRSIVDQLRELGYRLALDDMGAGYAGLASFALLSPDIVKIDMSLIRDIHMDRMRARIVRALVHLCHDLGMRVVAEGVENREEATALHELGPLLLQGYYFARPQPPFCPIDPAAQWRGVDPARLAPQP
jgi:EAL domain-containing protein (putative c-di-GMP-specific phosphodiesterase class I)